MLRSQSAKWKDRVQLERNFTMNGNWMDYYGKWKKGARELLQPVWGDSRIPFVVQYAGCQMCRGHSENGSWHDQGVKKCHNAFLEAYTFGDDQVTCRYLPFTCRYLPLPTVYLPLPSVTFRYLPSPSVTFGDGQALNAVGLKHLTMDTHLVRANPGSELFQRHQRMTRCLPNFLVVGTQKGGTSSFHWLLKSGWNKRIQVSNREKDVTAMCDAAMCNRHV